MAGIGGGLTMEFSIQTDLVKGAEALGKQARQYRFALERTIRGGAYRIRAVEQEEIRKVFDRPTPFIVNSVTVKDEAKAKLRAEVFFRYPGGKTTPPEKVLAAEILGGPRRAKRAEVALRRVGILPQGYFLVPGKGIAADKVDQYGNVKGSFIVQLLSYFRAFSEQGYRANMTDRRRAQLAKVKRTERGFKIIQGVQYFVSYGRLRSLSMASDKMSSLAPGIWSRRGIHGSNVQSVLMFVRQPTYAERFDFVGVGERVVRQEIPGMHAAYLRQALETAR
jgi:hypothetical protein